MSMKKYIFNKVGGGDHTADIGTVHTTMIADGRIIVVIRHGIEEYLMIGEIVIEIIGGVVVPGILEATVILIGIGGTVTVVERVNPAVGINPVVERVNPVVGINPVVVLVVERVNQVAAPVVEKVNQAAERVVASLVFS